MTREAHEEKALAVIFSDIGRRRRRGVGVRAGKGCAAIPCDARSGEARDGGQAVRAGARG